ncbi:MAG TPA: GT4 family glycosyltransferase PelF [Gaiellaceae bacterium]|nr:GT4 family glycosyltransferase PelF [Gaiellaceae bacterium]
MSDVALVVEGSYPYVTGGVSAWTQQLIEGLPDVSFSVVNLGEAGTSRYERPANLAELVDLAVDPETGFAEGELPEASVYHALATGSAGAVAAAAAAKRGRPFLLSEHGLAWLEARIGIVGCKGGVQGAADPARIEAQARRAYQDARAVTSVCSWGAGLQRALGARAPRVIQNAVAPATAPGAREGSAPVIGFVGRVVAVKDVLTFLEACRLVLLELPAARFIVIGPLDQDTDYADRCRLRAASLGLEVEFTGVADPSEWYPGLDALVLTSRSEAQPLVALEAMAAGVPVIATAVGGCPELLAGCGLVTRAGDPAGTAAAVLRVLGDGELRARLTAAATLKVEREHGLGDLLAAFAGLYEESA